MDLLSRFIIALGLSADAFAVSVSDGMCGRNVTKKHALMTAVSFGFFQCMMPILGFLLGRTFSDAISSIQHLVALVLLGAIGVNMIAEAVKEYRHPENVCNTDRIFSARNLLLQGIATSIDALAIGVGFAAMKVNICTSSLLIGIVTFTVCIIGVFIGKRFGLLLGLRARLAGGILLIIIGLKIFIENLL